MKKLFFFLLLCGASYAGMAQSQFFCKSSVQQNIDSWAIVVHKSPDWFAPGPIQYRTTTYNQGTGVSTTGAWMPFSSPQTVGFMGLGGGVSQIEIRILRFNGSVYSQFFVTNNC